MPIVFHSDPLRALTEKLDLQNDTLGKARFDYLSKEAERKHFESTIILNSLGRSHAERLVQAQGSTEWLEFHQALARLEAIYEFQRLKFEVLGKEWQAEYLTLKVNSEVIKKQGGL